MATEELHMKPLRHSILFLLISSMVVLGGYAATSGKSKNKRTIKSSKPQTLPVTTASAEAARYFEKGMVEYENHRWNLALNDWRDAVKLDVNFALAYTWICLTTTDPAEESSNRALAKASIAFVTPGEQLMVRWMIGIHENNYVEGISAMNDMLGMYPRDKRVNFLVAYWLYRQDQYDLAEKLTLKALAEDANYATAYNQLGYIYSRRGDYQKAIDATAKYVKLLPNEPNPHDSYAEMLRLSGRFDQALEHYHIALKIDPTFYISQKELGETYAVMGDEERARIEYAKAVEEAPSTGLKAEYLQKSAMTYLRDKQYDQADKAFIGAAEQAYSMEQWIWEARAHRIMAMYQSDSGRARKELDRAHAILNDKKGAVAQADLDEETARIWRVRVERAAQDGDFSLAHKALHNLEKMANTGGSVSIERTYHAAAGTLLLAEGKFADAASQLEEDFANPLSMKVLLTAYEKSGATDKATALRKKLSIWRIPGVEEALVAPEFRTPQGPIVSQK